MSPVPISRLPHALEHAIQRIKLAVREAAERTVESLGIAALAATQAGQRDALLTAQFELNRKLAPFALRFEEAYDSQLRRDFSPRSEFGSLAPPTRWDALSLVDDHEVEVKVLAERFAFAIIHACEWELRELQAYVAALLGEERAERDRSPLRPELIGHGVILAIEAIVDRAEARKLLGDEFSRSLAGVLRLAYAQIVTDLRQAGVKPLGLSVRATEGRAAAAENQPAQTPAAAMRDAIAAAQSGPGSRHGALDSRQSVHGALLGQVDAGMMNLLRRLAQAQPAGPATSISSWDATGAGAQPLPNLIRAHRDELRQAARGAIDHMVIDVIGSLFDQILSDPKLPPQMTRHIARLQLPVLRAALGDPSFFSSRRHPVRRFVNRIASLGAGFDDFADEHGRQFLAKVRDLVQEVVQGDFDQIQLYDAKLQALEQFVADQAREDIRANGDAEVVLARKEEELRLQQALARRLQEELKGLTAPEFVHDFVIRVWSQVLLKAAEKDGTDGQLLRRFRGAGRELFMSVQAKTSPAQRKTFLAELPRLMQDLNEGLNLIAWPDAERRQFFGQLLPAHADALKAPMARQLDHNLMARQVEGALERKLPTQAELPAAGPMDDDSIAPRFSAAEAARVGLLQESAVDWNGKVDIDLGTEPEISAKDLAIPGLPAPTDHPEPSRGRSLADHVQIGFSYQMHLDGHWQKVRLTHVSPARTFFVFTVGKGHHRAISMTYRMLARLCESGRLRAFESAYLIERATARARRQLAALSTGAR